MDTYPLPAQRLVAEMTDAAARAPERAISFQGAPGANSHLAVMDFAPDGLPLPCFSFEDALDAVRDGRADRAMIPIENSLHGRVADMHFLLPESGLSIIDEYFLPIHHSLMSADDTPPVSALSHVQALGQCRKYLRSRGIRPIVYVDTAGAAALVAEVREPGAAAIAPSLAARLYGLTIHDEKIEDSSDNMTRFVVLGRDAIMPSRDGPVMTSFLFEVKNIPAALYKAMGGFATNGVNMTKLESYQRGASFSATEFYADIEGMPGDPAVDRALEELAFHSKWVRLLGSYPQGRSRSI
ncbi:MULTISPECIES: prephenate dehydratase [unclassified Sphingobium]|uniref:prephenate dehydratase n=1 Tax=unclassified Sphingobium TaxID=2611147 RepID=UPI002224AB0C|nr:MULTISPECIES: prephenate dehydratase [unclassified Sphingobium]MCW2383289.1 prephenate dehydratase [Sphingobium sp. B2D3B]MCW2399736.1 prephenate dehydratase [Sphingobium sp. B2D3C]